MIVKICVGSSCHLKGSGEIVKLLTDAVNDHSLQDEVTLTGSFCFGTCNRTGVTVEVDETVHTGITTENFREFFNEHILGKLKK